MLNRRRVVWAVVVVLAALLAVYVPTPYYALCPGPVINLGEAVAVNGKTDPGGGVRMLSVAAVQSSTAFLVYAGLHPGLRVIHRDQLVPPGMDMESYLDYAEGQMRRSQAVAELVAAREAGVQAQLVGGGLRVVSVAGSSPWQSRVEEGDVITGIDSIATRLLEEFAAALGTGDELRVERGENRMTIPYAVDDLESDARDLRKLLRGVTLENEPWTVEAPFDVSVSVSDVRGPSAALALSLEIYRRLTGAAGDGRVVAATGTLRLDGQVGPVGGLAQKLAAAASSEVSVVLVPTGEKMPAYLPAGVSVVPVSSFGEAVRQTRQ